MNQTPSSGSRISLPAWFAWVGLFLLALLLGIPGNGAKRPLDAHEIFVARTALEMQRLGEYVVPYFGGQIRLQKPPLNYWMAIAAERAIHQGTAPVQTEWSARLPSIVLGALSVVATAALGWLVFDSLLIGALGALLFATSIGYHAWARSAQPEMAYTFACLLWIFAAAWARREALAGRGTWRASCCAGAALGLAVLVKGPLLPAFLLAGALIALRKRAGGPGGLRTLHVGAGLAMALVCSVPYFLIVAQRAPDAAEFWRAQMFDRTGGLGQAWWRPLEFFYVGQALKLLLPWSALLVLIPYGLVRDARSARAREHGSDESTRSSSARFLAWCALVPCVVLSFSAGRKGYYLLPTMPLWCLLGAWAVARAFERAGLNQLTARRLTLALRVHGAVLAAAAAAVLGLIIAGKSRIELETAYVVALAAGLALAALLAVLGSVLAERQPRRAALALLACACLGSFAIAATGLSSSPSRYSHGEFAREVARSADPSRPLRVIEGDQQTLLFYCDQPVSTLRAEDLPLELTRTPLPWIVDRQSNWVARGSAGRVVVREQTPQGEDPNVLIDPTPGAGQSTAVPHKVGTY